MNTYCFEFQPTFYSYPIEPVKLSEELNLEVDQALGMFSFGDGITSGTLIAETDKSAKNKVSRIIRSDGRWTETYHPMWKEYFRVYGKGSQSDLFLWEKTGKEIEDKFTDQEQKFHVGDVVDKLYYKRHGDIEIKYHGEIVYVQKKHEDNDKLPTQFIYGFTDEASKQTMLECNQYQLQPAGNPSVD